MFSALLVVATRLLGSGSLRPDDVETFLLPSHTQTAQRAPGQGGGSANVEHFGSKWEEVDFREIVGLGRLSTLAALGCLFILVLMVWTLIECVNRRLTSSDVQVVRVGVETQAPEEVKVKKEVDPRLSTLNKKRAEALLHETVARKRTEQVLEEIEALKAEIRSKEEQTQAELEEEAEAMSCALETATHASLLTAFSFTVPVLNQASEVHDIVAEHVKKTQDMAYELMMKQSRSMLEEVGEHMGVQGLGDITKVKSLDVPTAATFVAIAIAPLQLRMLYASNKAGVAFIVLALATSSVVVFNDWRHACHSPRVYFRWGLSHSALMRNLLILREKVDVDHVYGWFFVDFVMELIQLIVRLRLDLMLGAAVEKLGAAPPMMSMKDALNPGKQVRALIHQHITAGGLSLTELDDIQGSSLLLISGWITLFHFFWLLYAVLLMLEEPWQGCQTFGLFQLRVRGLSFLVVLVPYIVFVSVFLVTKIFSQKTLNYVLMRVACNLDVAMGVGIPIFRVIVAGVLVSSVREEMELCLTLSKAECYRLEGERARLREELSLIDEKFAKKEAEAKLMAERLDGLTGHNQEVEEALENAKEFLEKLEAAGEKIEASQKAKAKAFLEEGGHAAWEALQRGEGPPGVDIQHVLDGMQLDDLEAKGKLASRYLASATRSVGARVSDAFGQLSVPAQTYPGAVGGGGLASAGAESANVLDAADALRVEQVTEKAADLLRG